MEEKHPDVRIAEALELIAECFTRMTNPQRVFNFTTKVGTDAQEFKD